MFEIITLSLSNCLVKVPVKVPYPVKVKTPYIVKVPYVVKIPVYHKEKYPVPIPVPEKVSYSMKEPIVEHGGYEHGSHYSGASYGGHSSYGHSSYGNGGDGGHGLYSDHSAANDHVETEKQIVVGGSPHGYEYKQSHTLSYDSGKGHEDVYGGQSSNSKYASLPEYDTASYSGTEKYKYSTLSMGEESGPYDGQGYAQPKTEGHYETGYETKAY